MLEFWLSLGIIEKFFAYSACFGSLFFVFRMISIFFGFMSSGVTDASLDLDGDAIPDAMESVVDYSAFPDADGDGIPDIFDNDGSVTDLVDASPKLGEVPEKIPLLKSFLSLQNLSAFFMMLGWVGLAMMHSSGFGAVPALIAGFFAGTATTWVIIVITNWLMKLVSSGNVRIASAKGKIGRVYLRIPPGDSGQVEIAIDGRLKICDAVNSNEKEEIKSDTEVLVVDVNSEGILVVVPNPTDSKS